MKATIDPPAERNITITMTDAEAGIFSQMMLSNIRIPEAMSSSQDVRNTISNTMGRLRQALAAVGVIK